MYVLREPIFLKRMIMSAGVGYEAFNPKYLFSPDALIYNAAGSLKLAAGDDRRSGRLPPMPGSCKPCTITMQLLLNAFTEVVNRLAKVRNYTSSIEIKNQQLGLVLSRPSQPPAVFFRMLASNIGRALAPRPVTLRMSRMQLIRRQTGATTAVVERLSGPRRRSRFGGAAGLGARRMA